VEPERCRWRGREKCDDREFWYTDILGCSMSRFSMGEVSMCTGPSDVKHGGGVRNHDSSNDKQGIDDSDEVLVRERCSSGSASTR
jgi:hypothetical protein